MGELEKIDIYACALAMPSPTEPKCGDWVEEIQRHVDSSDGQDVFLVGHSLGVSAILRYLESRTANKISGMILVSGPAFKNNNWKIDSFLETGFDFELIKSRCSKVVVIHGDNDQNVPKTDAEYLSQCMNAELILIPNGGHLNGSSGWLTLPQCLDSLARIL